MEIIKFGNVRAHISPRVSVLTLKQKILPNLETLSDQRIRLIDNPDYKLKRRVLFLDRAESGFLYIILHHYQHFSRLVGHNTENETLIAKHYTGKQIEDFRKSGDYGM